MFVLVVFVVALLLIAACGGSGVVLQQILYVVEKPLEFARPAQVDVEPVPEPEPAAEPNPEPVVRSRVTHPRAPHPRPVRPRPARPTQPEPGPEPTEPEPPLPESMQPEPTQTTPGEGLAPIQLTGDAAQVRVLGGPEPRALPTALPPGRYDIEVTFAGGQPFVAASLLVMDAQPQTVACRQALGICTVK